MNSDEDDYEYEEYAYSSDEDGYPVDDDVTNSSAASAGSNLKVAPVASMPKKAPPQDMEWASSDNPNAAPQYGSGRFSASGKKTGVQMLLAADLRPDMERRIQEVVEVLQVPAAAAAILLHAFSWNKDDLLSQYCDASERVLKQAGVEARCSHCHKPAAAAKSDSNLCNICYDEVEEDEESMSDDHPRHMMSMPCGHAFCTDCWFDFSAHAVKEEGYPAAVDTLTCPDASCPERVTSEELTLALAHRAPELLKKYEHYQLRSFVDSNPLTRWCPGPGCERVATASSALCLEPSATGHTVQCTSCETTFCLPCGLEPHAPTSCSDLLRWQEKCRNESETANWILANTKTCPKCVSRIEKNQGCNHMTCQRCRHEFCWICMGDWHDHGANTGGYYKCNKYDSAGMDTSGSGGEGEDAAAKAKRDLDRYLHYYKRFHAHSEAQNFAQKQLAETETRMVLLQEAEKDHTLWSDVEFLKQANEQLVECRRVLKYTYVFAYYLPDAPPKPSAAAASAANNKKQSSVSTRRAASLKQKKEEEQQALQAQQKQQMNQRRERFEHHQEMLERFTENLSELSEKPLAEMDRTTVVNQTRVVDRFMKNVLQYVQEGMEE